MKLPPRMMKTNRFDRSECKKKSSEPKESNVLLQRYDSETCDESSTEEFDSLDDFDTLFDDDKRAKVYTNPNYPMLTNSRTNYNRPKTVRQRPCINPGLSFQNLMRAKVYTNSRTNYNRPKTVRRRPKRPRPALPYGEARERRLRRKFRGCKPFSSRIYGKIYHISQRAYTNMRTKEDFYDNRSSRFYRNSCRRGRRSIYKKYHNAEQMILAGKKKIGWKKTRKATSKLLLNGGW